MSLRAAIILLLTIGCLPPAFAAPPTITYRLESSGVFTGPEHGNLYPRYHFDDDDWNEVYLQEMRLFVKGKASPQVGYRIEPRFQYTYADSAGEFDWTLDQAYAYVDFSDKFSVTGGKQRIRWGTGMTFTPTDRWQPAANTLDPTRYLEGTYLFKADLFLPIASLTAVYTPSREHVEYRVDPDHVVGLRLYKLIGTLDIYLSATRSIYSRRGSINGRTSNYDEYETNYGAAFSWDSGPAVIYGEASHLKLTSGTIRHLLVPDVNTWQQRFVLGTSKQFNSSSSGYIEAYYNGWGLSHSDYKRLNKILGQLQGFYGPYIENTPFADFVDQVMQLGSPARSLHQWYIALNGTYIYKETWGVTGNVIYEPVDNSCFVYPLLTYRGVENMDFMLGYSTVFGSSDGEKALMPAIHAVDFRFIVYF